VRIGDVSTRAASHSNYTDSDHRRPYQSCSLYLPNMSYGKKDEDADVGLVKVDRTQVFQEGENWPSGGE
jgi:hypothetical protein